ncbi:hypothetical protein ACQPZX_12475 [Actinoplanes sp. CA-142083]|uniref:hypothetical protein n=1 Tax=Actinoplanes sp. CA-142083 TaxID=3239903 RepID=UPI003D92B863
MTQSQRTAERSHVEAGPEDPRAVSAARRRFILTQPPPPHPKPRRPERDDEEPSPLPSGGTEANDRCDELLAEIDELVGDR